MKKKKILLIIGPTAVGKSSIIEKALEDFPQLCDIITYTTRPMRAGEVEGAPYHFVTEERFKALEAQKFFIETANVHGRLYGTPRDQVQKAAEAGLVIILDIDVQGARRLMQEFPESVTVFLMPPSLEVLRERFIKRGITNQADLERRLESAAREMAQAQDFQHLILNDHLESAYDRVCQVIRSLVAH